MADDYEDDDQDTEENQPNAAADYAQYQPQQYRVASQDDSNLPVMSQADYMRMYGGKTAPQEDDSNLPVMSQAEYMRMYGGQAQPEERADESEFGAGLRSFAHSVLPTVTGAIAGTALGTAVGGPFGTIPGFVAGVAGGAATGYAAGKAQEATLSAIGMDDSHTLALNAQKYPWSTAIGGALPAALTFQPGAIGTTLAQRAGQAGLAGAIDVGTQYATTGEVDPRGAAVSAATGFLLPGTQRWVERAAAPAAARMQPWMERFANQRAAAAQAAATGAPAQVPAEPPTVETQASRTATSDSQGTAQAKPPPQDVDTDVGQEARPAQPGATGQGDAPEPPVRFYHGGDNPQSGGGRWVSPSLEYATNYRPGQTVHQVDIPQSWLDQKFPDTELYKGPGAQPYPSFEAPEEFAQQMTPVPSMKAQPPFVSSDPAIDAAMKAAFPDETPAAQPQVVPREAAAAAPAAGATPAQAAPAPEAAPAVKVARNLDNAIAAIRKRQAAEAASATAAPEPQRPAERPAAPAPGPAESPAAGAAPPIADRIRSAYDAITAETGKRIVDAGPLAKRAGVTPEEFAAWADTRPDDIKELRSTYTKEPGAQRNKLTVGGRDYFGFQFPKPEEAAPPGPASPTLLTKMREMRERIASVESIARRLRAAQAEPVSPSERVLTPQEEQFLARAREIGQQEQATARPPSDYLKLQADISHTDYVNRLQELRDNKPQPVNKLWRNPDKAPPEQVAAQQAKIKAWNNEYNRVSRIAKLALARDNEAFRARQEAVLSETPESFWTYKAPKPPTLEAAVKADAIAPDTTQGEWDKLSPGMKRAIVREADRQKTVPAVQAQPEQVAAAKPAASEEFTRLTGIAPTSSTTLREAMSKLDMSTVSGLNRHLSETLRKVLGKLVGDVPVHFVAPGDMENFSGGRGKGGFNLFDPRTNRNHIGIRTDRTGDVRSLLHEGVHAAAIGAVEKSPKARQAVRLLMNELKARTEPVGHSANVFLDEHEFLADAHTNPTVQGILAKLPTPPQLAKNLKRLGYDISGRPGSLWDSFMDVLRNILKLPRSSKSLLETTIRVGEHIMRPEESVRTAGVPIGEEKAIPEAGAQPVARQAVGPAGESGAAPPPPPMDPPGPPPANPVPPKGPSRPPGTPPGSLKDAVPPPAEKSPANVANWLHDMLDWLRRNRDADLPDAENKIRNAQQKAGYPVMGWLQETAARLNPYFRKNYNDREQRLYRSVEDRDDSQLTSQDKIYKKTLEDDWGKEIADNRARVKELQKADGVPAQDDDDEVGFIRRLRKGFQGDQSVMGNDDPLYGAAMRGGDKGTFRERVFHGMTADDGEHLVIGNVTGGKSIRVFKPGEEPVTIDNPYEGRTLGQLHGEKLDYNGKEYTIGNTRARDITAAIPEMQYHESYTASRASELMQTREAVRQAELFHDIRTNPDHWGAIRTFSKQQAEAMEPQSWEQTDVPGLKGVYFDPLAASALNRVYKMQPENWISKLNDIAVSSIFLNPIPHTLNEAYHWAVGRGEDWLKPSGYYNLFKSGGDAITSLLKRDDDYVAALNSRAPMVNAGRNRSEAFQNIAALAGLDAKRAPHQWDILANKFGFRAPGDLIRSIYDASASTMWTAGDLFRLQRIKELKLQGMTTDEAIREMARHQPDYRLPLTIMGSPKVAEFLAGQNYGRLAVMFTRYHYTLFNSLADMVKNAAVGSPDERRKAIGHLMVLGLLAYVAKPYLLDPLAKMITGNKDAEFKPRGPLAPLAAARDYAAGKKDIGQTVSSIVTPTPVARLASEVFTNRDWAGRQIVNPMSSAPDQLAQALEHLAQSIISPYSTYQGTLMPGSAKGNFANELRDQFLDIKEQTARQKSGQAFGMRQEKSQAQRRAKRPAGLIEYGTRQLEQLGR